MQAISREALPLPSTPKGVTTLWATKWAFIYVMRAEPKNSVITYRRVPIVRNYIWEGLTNTSKAPRVKPRVRNDQCKYFYKRYLSPARKPKLFTPLVELSDHYCPALTRPYRRYSAEDGQGYPHKST